MCLRDKAVGWFKVLSEDGVDTYNWDTVKTEFLESFEQKYSAKSTCANFTDLNQKSEEYINDYTYHVQMAYKRLTDKKPAAMAAVRAAVGANPANVKAEGITDSFKLIKHQLFLAGLKDGIRDKVLEAAKDTFTKSVKVTRNVETIQNDHKRLNHINAIKQELQEERAKEIIWENLSDKSLISLRSFVTPDPKSTAEATMATKPVPPPPLETLTLPADTARKKAICKRTASPARGTRPPWWTETASLTRTRTIASTTLPSNPLLLLLLNLLPRPATKMPISACITI
jgi:hypothetical protein